MGFKWTNEPWTVIGEVWDLNRQPRVILENPRTGKFYVMALACAIEAKVK